MEFIFDQNKRANNAMGMTDFSVHSPIKRQRRPVANVEEIEITGQRKRKRRPAAPVKYVSGSKRKSKSRAKPNMSWTKFGWLVCGCLFLRLIFMDSGVIDFYKMEDSILDKKQSLSLTIKDNQELMNEIHKIKTSPKYQKKMAREHLDVIAPNEYLVIFAKDS